MFHPLCSLGIKLKKKESGVISVLLVYLVCVAADRLVSPLRKIKR